MFELSIFTIDTEKEIFLKAAEADHKNIDS